MVDTTERRPALTGTESMNARRATTISDYVPRIPVLVALLAALTWGQAKGAAELRVRLLDGETGKGVYHADVVVRGLDTRPVGPWGGYYCFYNVPFGEWVVVVQRQRYWPGSITVVISSEGTIYDTVYLRPASPRTVVVGVRSGRTTRPISGALVNVAGQSVSVSTDYYGEAVLTNLPTGVISITAWAEDYREKGVRTVIDGPDTEYVRLDLQDTLPDRIVYGRVVDQLNGRVLKQARVRFKGIPGPAVTDQSGNYSVVGLRPGWREYEAEKRGYLPESADVMVRAADSSFLDIALYDSTRVSLYGRVRDREGYSPSLASIQLVGTAVSGSVSPRSGLYRLLDVPQGTYLMKFSAPEWYPESAEVTVLKGTPVRGDMIIRHRLSPRITPIPRK